jgi:uncharacterized protein YbjT (DUF2867 family)
MILVTGATGTVGKELVPQLLAAGEQVRVFIRDKQKVSGLEKRVEIAVGDLNKRETLEPALRGVDKVFHVVLDMGTQQDRNIVVGASDAGVKHVVKLSTFNAGRPQLQLDRWHHEKEEVVRSSGLAWTFIRPGQFMSNTLRWAETVKQQSTVYFPGGEGRVSPIHPKDIAAVAAAALIEAGHESQAYELTGPQLFTVAEQVEILARIIGKPIRYVDVPEEKAGEGMKKSGIPGPVADALVEVFKERRRGTRGLLTDTVEKVTKRPPRTFEAWCHENAAAFR